MNRGYDPFAAIQERKKEKVIGTSPTRPEEKALCRGQT